MEQIWRQLKITKALREIENNYSQVLFINKRPILKSYTVRSIIKLPDNMREKLKVLIVGAGPAGLTAALEFAKKGIVTTIVEKRNGPSNLSRAVGIMPESLVKLGEKVATTIHKECVPFSKMNAYIDGKRYLSLDFTGKLQPSEMIVGLPQDRTEKIIYQALSKLGVQVQYGTKVTNIKTNDTEATVWFDEEESPKKYDWVIACDGKKSTIRQQLGIDYVGYEVDGDWSIADVQLNEVGFDYKGINLWMKLPPTNDVVIALPIGKNRLRIISSSANCLETIPHQLDIAKTHRQGTFNISIRQATQYKVGRVLLAGDSAHCHSPVGGKGMNLGIGDAVAAVKAILKGQPDLYHQERHPVGVRVIKQTESIRKKVMSTNPLIKVLLKLLFPMVSKSSRFQNIAFQNMSRL